MRRTEDSWQEPLTRADLIREQPSSWQEPLTRAQVWIAALGLCVVICGSVGTFVMVTRETALRLEWRVQQAERILTELQAAKDVQRLSLEVRATQNALRTVEMQIARLRRQ